MYRAYTKTVTDDFGDIKADLIIRRHRPFNDEECVR